MPTGYKKVQIGNIGSQVDELDAYENMCKILGKHMIDPRDIGHSSLNGIFYDNLLRVNLRKQLVFAEKNIVNVMAVKDFLFVGPPVFISLIHLHNNFFPQKSVWYMEPREQFAREEFVNPGWLMARYVAGSTNKSLDEQLQMLTEGERLATAVEVAWMFLLNYAVYKKPLSDLMIRTSSVNMHGGNVAVGILANQSETGKIWIGGSANNNVGIIAITDF